MRGRLLLLSVVFVFACGDDGTALDGAVDSGGADAGSDGASGDAAGGDSGMGGDADLSTDSGVDASADAASDAATDAGPADAMADAADAAVDAADAATPGKRVFLLDSTMSPGDIGSAADADTLCQTNADARALGGTWMAWISDATTSPADRFTRASVPYRRLDGALIANDWDDLVDGTLADTINRTASGSRVITGYAATGTLADGTAAGTAASRCDDWTDSSAGSALNGSVTRTDTGWTTGVSRPCYSLHRLYCFEQ